MKKVLLVGAILLLSISLFGCTEIQPQNTAQQSDESDKETVEKLVKEFGSRLQTVSLHVPENILKQSIQENYSSFISPKLLEEWLSDPKKAPGRLTSSPWPDRIEIISIKEISEDSYEVEGEIIEITSVEKVNGGAAAKRSITLTLRKIGESWLIDAVTLGEYE